MSLKFNLLNCYSSIINSTARPKKILRFIFADIKGAKNIQFYEKNFLLKQIFKAYNFFSLIAFSCDSFLASIFSISGRDIFNSDYII